MSKSDKKFATSKVKWNESYREKHGIKSLKAPNLTEDEVKRIQLICKKAYKVLGLNGYARIDVRYTDDGKVYILEANPNPGIAFGEEFPDSAEDIKMKYEDVIAKIVSLGLNWYHARK